MKRQQLTGADKIRYEIHDAIKAALDDSKSMNELQSKLAARNIEVIYKYLSGTNEVHGISFAMGGYTFKGSAISHFSQKFIENLMQITEFEPKDKSV